MTITRRALLPLLLVPLIPYALLAQVSSERLLRAAAEPQNWLTYSGTYSSQRYSQLKQITPANVKDLEMKWVFQAQSLQSFSATPLVVDGIMYVTWAPNEVVALDAASGRIFWTYHYAANAGRLCCRGLVNRGVAILDDTLFMATVDAHLVAIDAKNGRPLWNTKVAESTENYGMTLAPLVLKDKVVVGVAGGEFGIRGFIAAYGARTGKLAWKFYTIPGPGELGHDTWPQTGNAWEHGGAPVWITGSYDPDLNLTYWGTGNPGPDYNQSQRTGTTSSPTASSRSTPTRESSNGIFSSLRTIHTITTRCRFPFWSMRTGMEARASSCCGATATASFMSSTEPRGRFYWVSRTRT